MYRAKGPDPQERAAEYEGESSMVAMNGDSIT